MNDDPAPAADNHESAAYEGYHDESTYDEEDSKQAQYPGKEEVPAAPSGRASRLKFLGICLVALLGIGLVVVRSRATQPAPTASPDVEPASWEMADRLIKDAQRQYKKKDFRAASRDANDAYRIFETAAGVPEARLKALNHLRRKANLALADSYLEASEKFLESKNWDTATARGDDAAALYQEFKGAPQKRKRAIVVAETARRLRREGNGN